MHEQQRHTTEIAATICQKAAASKVQFYVEACALSSTHALRNSGRRVFMDRNAFCHGARDVMTRNSFRGCKKEEAGRERDARGTGKMDCVATAGAAVVLAGPRVPSARSGSVTRREELSTREPIMRRSRASEFCDPAPSARRSLRSVGGAPSNGSGRCPGSTND